MPQRINNTIDIYRKKSISRQSPEHILQAGLGSDLEVIGLIDHDTNVEFGATIDKQFVEDFSLIRSQIGLKAGEEIRSPSRPLMVITI